MKENKSGWQFPKALEIIKCKEGSKEFKRQRGGRTSDHQSEWLDALSAQGYKAALCYGWEQAAGTIIEYLTGGGTHD